MSINFSSALVSGEEYKIGENDLIKITVYEEPDLSRTFKVTQEGIISYPLLGRIRVKGLTVTELEKSIEKSLAADFLINPQASILIEQYGSQKIYIMGEVSQPGLYDLRGPTTLLEALSRAGGLKPTAGNQLVITRSQEKSDDSGSHDPISIDLEALLKKGDTSLNVSIVDSDVLHVSTANSFFVFGEVKNPGSFVLKKDVSILQAITMAGGFTKIASPSKVRVIRGKGKDKTIIHVDVKSMTTKGDKEGEVLLESDDIVIVPESFF